MRRDDNDQVDLLFLIELRREQSSEHWDAVELGQLFNLISIIGLQHPADDDVLAIAQLHRRGGAANEQRRHRTVLDTATPCSSSRLISVSAVRPLDTSRAIMKPKGAQPDRTPAATAAERSTSALL
jgi:hypothetical protein